MRFKIQTSTSKLIPIGDLEYIRELARCSRCNIFVLLASTNCLYGTLTESYSVHEIPLPFKVNTDLVFKLDAIDKDYFTRHDPNQQYFIPDKYSWAILPEEYWNDYINDNLEQLYDYTEKRYFLRTKDFKTRIDCINMTCSDGYYDKETSDAISQIEGFLNYRMNTISSTVGVFFDMESNETIRKVFDGKTSDGRALLRLTDEYLKIDVLFYIFKSMCALNKYDKLTIEITPTNRNPKVFMATFITSKKTNPIKIKRCDISFKEKIHFMYLNLL